MSRIRLPRVPSVPGHPKVRNYAPWMVSGATLLPNLPAALVADDPLLALSGLGAALALLLLRRYPWALTAVLLGGSALSRVLPLFFVPFWDAACLAPLVLLSVRQVRPTYAVVIAQLLLAVSDLWRHPDETLLVLTVYAIFLGIGVGGGVFLYLPLRRMDRLTAETNKRVLRQRRAMAQQIHDNLARRTTHMVIYAQRARDKIDPDEDPRSAATLDEIVATGHRSLLRLREMMQLLNEENPDPGRLAEVFPHRRVGPPRPASEDSGRGSPGGGRRRAPGLLDLRAAPPEPEVN